MTGRCVPMCRGMAWIEYRQANETIDITRPRSAQTTDRSLLHKQKEELNMDEKDKKIIEEEILGKDHAGYAYLYPFDGGRQEYVFDMTPEHIANFLGAHQFDAEKIILTDMLDRLILNTIGGFIDQCPDQELCRQIIPLLAPIQMGETEAKEIPIVTMEAFDEYGRLEDEMVTAAEYGMML